MRLHISAFASNAANAGPKSSESSHFNWTPEIKASISSTSQSLKASLETGMM